MKALYLLLGLALMLGAAAACRAEPIHKSQSGSSRGIWLLNTTRTYESGQLQP
jgi:hypothetical protein